MIFASPFHNDFGVWPLAYAPYGGADFGEVVAVAEAVGDGDDGAYYEAWMRAGDRLAAEANDALAESHRVSARELFLRASCFYAASYRPIYGEPVDPRLLAAFEKQTAAFDMGQSLSEPAVTPIQIPFESTPLPAYLIPAERYANEVRPLIIFTNGYDANITDMYFASVVAASRRGYHCLMFDGPGQGEMLIKRGLRLRHDWENVVKAVVDFAVDIPLVDPDRMAISGWSLGGYLATRGASGEHRLRACIADPGQLGLAWGFRDFAIKLGATPQAASDLNNLDDALVDKMWGMVLNDRGLRWSIVQRGFWVHGVNNLRDYIRAAQPFTMEGRAERIRCPTLFTMAENDTLAKCVPDFFDALRCPKTLIRFKASEGAGTHCEMGNRSLLNRKALDWLDGVMAE